MEIYPKRTLPSLALGQYYNLKKDKGRALFYYKQSRELLKTDLFIYNAYRHRLEDIIGNAIKEIDR